MSTDTALVPGAKLRNGATIKMIRFDQPDRGVVLAKWRNEYVVWTVNRDGDTFNGRYFDIDQSIKARAEFFRR